MDILIFSILTNLLYFCCGSLIVSNQKTDFYSQFYIYFIGVISLSFIALFLNFFTELSVMINSAIYVSIIVIFVIKKKTFEKRNINFLLLSSLITFVLIIYSNVNRPDAGLYHLPYISLINENKIIFGASNIHFRFGHISILQYLSAINNNYLFLENGISIPLASIVSFFYLYYFSDIWKVIKKKDRPDIGKFFSLFILIYIAFKITRYSSFGNDAVAHLSFFYLISCIFKEDLKKISFNKILVITVFIFANKPMLGVVFLIPALLFIIQNNLNLKKVFNVVFSFPALLLYLWLIKNIIVSGCLVFPIKVTCNKNLPWTNTYQITNINILGEAWAKGWPERTDTNISMKSFSKDFNWVKAWSKKHLKYILNIIIPYFLFISLIVFYIKIKFKSFIHVDEKDIKIKFALLLSTNIIGLVSFFFLFPVYRYGYSYLVSTIILVFIIIIGGRAYLIKNIPIFKYLLIFCTILILGKQVQKIYNNSSNERWPNIYTLDVNKTISKKNKIKMKDDFFYYHSTENENLCMYSKSPCTTNLIDKNIKHIKTYTYSFLVVN